MSVDEFEDAESSAFQKVQSLSTRSPQLLETEGLENRAFREYAGICLGRRGSGVQIAPPRPMESIRCRLRTDDADSRCR